MGPELVVESKSDCAGLVAERLRADALRNWRVPDMRFKRTNLCKSSTKTMNGSHEDDMNGWLAFIFVGSVGVWNLAFAGISASRFGISRISRHVGVATVRTVKAQLRQHSAESDGVCHSKDP